MRTSLFGRARLLVALVAVVSVFAIFLYLRPGGDFVTRAVNDIGQAVAAFAGGFACLWRARRTSGRMRLSWVLIGMALVCWGGGEVVWSYYEIILRRDIPLPSFADLGFLLLPLLALPGLLVRPSGAFANRSACVRVLLDGVMIAGSLFTLSWATSLGAVYGQGAQSLAAFSVSLAYPVGDALMVTVAVSVLVHTKARSGLPTLVLGLTFLSVADSGFVYLVATDNYNVVSYPDVAWVAAFLLIGAAALSPAENVVVGEVPAREPQRPLLPSPVYVFLPYAVVLVGVAAQIAMLLNGQTTRAVFVVEGLTMSALFVRQMLVVADNRAMARDILSQQAQLRFRAFHDSLTGLANRALFRDRVDHALELHRRNKRGVAVVLIDLDDFKVVNDSFGHDAGDALLVAVGDRLEMTTRSADTVARLGGDEFAVLCEDEVDVETVAARLLAVLADPIDIAGRMVSVRASLGTACVRSSDKTPTGEEFLKRADIAMYVAKESGKAMSVAYSPSLDMSGPDDLNERFALVDDIREGRLRIALQPMVRPDGNRFAFEALARWSRDGVEIAPDRFVPLAERAGVLPELDLLVASLAIAQLAVTPSPQFVSINLGMVTLRRADLVDRIDALLTGHGADPARLILEVSEGRAIAEPAIYSTIERLRGLGVKLAVDDFGVGYSNLARLAELTPEVIKFDKTLVAAIGSSTAADRLVAGAIDLAHDLGAVVVAEGVETPRQHAILAALGCDTMQGFLVGRPELVTGEQAGITAVPA